MSTPAGNVINDVLRAVNDVEASGHSRSLVLDLVSHAQRLVNYIIGAVVTTGNITLEEDRMVYPVSALLSDYLRPITAHYKGEQIISVDFDELALLDSSWPRGKSGEVSFYSPVGLDLMIFYPAVKKSETVTLTYVKDTGDIPGEGTNMSLPDHLISPVTFLATSLLLLRQRDLQTALGQFTTGLQEALRFKDE